MRAVLALRGGQASEERKQVLSTALLNLSLL